MIKASFLATVLFTAALTGTTANAKLLDAFNIFPKSQSGAVKDVYSGIKFHYMDKEDRLTIVNDFLKSVELEYALLPLKAERIGLDFKALKQEALDAETNAVDFNIAPADRKNSAERERVSFLQAASNMEFLDRMQALVAKFKDSHFSISEKIVRPFSYNGYRLFRIQGKIVVGSMDKKFIGMVSALSGTDFSGIQIGSEVVAIDGVPVEQKINELKSYISGSSEEFIDMMAVRSLTIRNFKYEKKNYTKVQFADGSVFKLPIFVNNSMQATPRLDAITYFNKYEVPSDASSIGISFDKTTGKWSESGISLTGYSTGLLKANLKGVTEMIGDDGSPAIRTGYYISKGKSYAVMQLLTFMTTNVKIGETSVSFLDAIRAFALDAKQNELPVILDLRNNGGGNGNFPAAVLSIFTEADKMYGSNTSGLRVTPYMRNLQEPFAYQPIQGEDQSFGLTYDDLRTLMDDALNDGVVYPPMYTMTGPIGADAKVQGFDQKMVVLVTPNCVSACDMTAFLFKESKRATIIGTSSNGTGAGFRSSGELNTNWEDPLRVISATIPNFLFGRPGPDLDKFVFGANSVAELCSENRPTIADVQYSNTPLDVMRNNLGWLQKAAEVLSQPE